MISPVFGTSWAPVPALPECIDLKGEITSADIDNSQGRCFPWAPVTLAILRALYEAGYEFQNSPTVWVDPKGILWLPNSWAAYTAGTPENVRDFIQDQEVGRPAPSLPIPFELHLRLF